MADFSDGVKRYIHTRGEFDVFFPVDFKDNADISCNQCRYYRNRICLITGEVTAYPMKYVGTCCPLKAVEEEEEP